MIHIDRIIDAQKILPFESYSNELIVRFKKRKGSFAEYIGCSNRNHISAAAYHKMLKTLKEKDYAILSANLHLDSMQENIYRNRILRASVNNCNMGVYQLIGHWTIAPEGTIHEEAEAKKQLKHAIEKIYAIPCVGMTRDAFIKVLTSLNVIAGQSQTACILHTAEGFFNLAVDAPNTEKGYCVPETVGNDEHEEIVQSYARVIAEQRGVTTDYKFKIEGMEVPANIQNRLQFRRHKIWYF